ncbi:MAG TPA: tetratricopeptide repeat protein [Aggregicoccus sp.]|nr:tetratricopeptide repeat protein [Aggregicoccus sp.]
MSTEAPRRGQGRPAGEARAVLEQLRRVERLRKGGHVEEALALLHELSAAHPRDARLQLELGLTLAIGRREPEQALPHYSAALGLAPAMLSVRLHRAVALAALGRHEEALQDLGALHAAHYRNATVVQLLRARSLAALGRPAEALAAWTAAIAADPHSPWLLEQRAQLRLAQGHAQAALADLDAAVRLTGTQLPDPELLRDRGRLHRQLGDEARARADFEAALAALGDSEEPLTQELRALRALSPSGQ